MQEEHEYEQRLREQYQYPTDELLQEERLQEEREYEAQLREKNPYPADAPLDSATLLLKSTPPEEVAPFATKHTESEFHPRFVVLCVLRVASCLRRETCLLGGYLRLESARTDRWTTSLLNRSQPGVARRRTRLPQAMPRARRTHVSTRSSSSPRRRRRNAPRRRRQIGAPPRSCSASTGSKRSRR